MLICVLVVFSNTEIYNNFLLSISRALPKFVANMPNKFPSSEIGRERLNEVRKFISMFEFLV